MSKELDEIRARDANSITWHGNFSSYANEAQADRRTLLALVDELTRERDAWEKTCKDNAAAWSAGYDSLQEQREAAIAERDALAADARRWAFLERIGPQLPLSWDLERFLSPEWQNAYSDDERKERHAQLGAAIDAALSAKEAKREGEKG